MVHTCMYVLVQSVGVMTGQRAVRQSGPTEPGQGKWGQARGRDSGGGGDLR